MAAKTKPYFQSGLLLAVRLTEPRVLHQNGARRYNGVEMLTLWAFRQH